MSYPYRRVICATYFTFGDCSIGRAGVSPLASLVDSYAHPRARSPVDAKSQASAAGREAVTAEAVTGGVTSESAAHLSCVGFGSRVNPKPGTVTR